MKKILCPVDFSENSKNALRYALELATLWDTQVDLIHIYHLEAADAAAVPYHQVEVLLEAQKTEIDRQFVDFTADLDTGRIGYFLKAYGIFTGLEIAAATREGEYALVVMGTRGERSSLEKLLGTVTTDLMTRSHCPVMAIPANAAFEAIKAVAYAVDTTAFDPVSGTTTPLEGLLSFTTSVGARLHVVHVAPEKGTGKDVELQVNDYPVPQATYAVINDESVEKGLDVYVRDHSIQVLAMYIRKRRLWERLFHKSHTRAMTFHTRIPLLVFHG